MLLRSVTAHVRAQNWFAVGVDFVIVVVGILIAFQITEWNEARRDRAREMDYLERIAVELENSITNIERSIELTREREALGRFLIRCVDDPGLVRAEPGRFVVALLFGGYTYSPVIRTQTLEEIKSVGDLGIFRDKDLLLDLTEYYAAVQLRAQWTYLRELNQTEYVRRSAGILTLELLDRTHKAAAMPDIEPEVALRAHTRMLERGEFVEWLPNVVDRYNDLRSYETLLDGAIALRSRVLEALADDAAAFP